MPEMRANHLSASSIAAFKACPQRYRLSYVEGLRPAEDTESLRMGSNWHSCHETWANHPDNLEDLRLEAVVNHLNERYANIPPGFDKTKWELERQILLTSFIAYQWFWQNDPIEFLASEVPFNLPLHMPRSGMPISMDEVQRVGKIDHIIKWNGAICALERKSTSRTIAPDSDYWERSAKDTQVSQYALAFRDMIRHPNNLSAAVFGPFYELPLSQDKVAVVDEADRVLVESYTWHAWEGGKWYAATNVKEDGKYVATRMHQLIIGDVEEGQVIDHINGNGLDNRRCNLRIVTQHVNRLNADTRGTSFHKGTKRWVARITLDDRTHSLGYYDSEEDAHAAYLEAKGKALPDPFARMGNTLYCVWHKPTIKPCTLTQKETAEVLVSGKYNGQDFIIRRSEETAALNDLGKIWVNEVEVEIEPGKKGFAIRETVEMYAARLLADIQERPDFYFQRKEIVRTDAELKEFRKELYGIYTAQRLYKENDCWFSNESACRATYTCPYVKVCYGPGVASVCDGKTTPEGFKRLFKVDLTIEGSVVELED